jgi:hypothetical protein
MWASVWLRFLIEHNSSGRIEIRAAFGKPDDLGPRLAVPHLHEARQKRQAFVRVDIILFHPLAR